MSIVEIIASVIAVLAVTAVAWMYSQQRRRHRLPDHHREWIKEALDSITREADKKRLHLNAVPVIDVGATFAQLHSLVEAQPGEVVSGAEELERLWNELNDLVEETVPEPDASEISSLKARATRLADRMDQLALEIQQELE